MKVLSHLLGSALIAGMSSFVSAATLLDIDFDITLGTWGTFNGEGSGTILNTSVTDTGDLFGYGTFQVYLDNLLVVDGLTSIPEPSAGLLAGAVGLAGLLVLPRRCSN